MINDLMQNMFLNAKNQVEEEKKILANKIIDFESSDKKILVKVSADGKLKDLKISQELLKEEVEMVEDLLVININKALIEADKVRDVEMEKLKKDMIPDLGDIMNSLGNFDDEDDVNI